MTQQQVITGLTQRRLVAILRGAPADKAPALVETLLRGGVHILEFTFDHGRPGYLDDTCLKVRRVKEAFGDDVLVGCGTVLCAEEADAAADAGAQLMICPHTDAQLIVYGKRRGMVCIPGALTPTEVVAAHHAGADMVKLFPAGELGLGYIRALRAPLPHIPLLAVGGVKPDNVGEFLSAGVTGFGVGSQLVDEQALRDDDFDGIFRRAQAFTAAIAAWEHSHGNI